MTAEADRFYMALALDLARQGLGRTSPNPAVGCVVTRDGQILGRGYHAAAGKPHAEVVALREAGSRAAGSDLYVSLEPCAHHGRTPPCAELVARSGVRRVVAATRDPNPRVAGQGIEILRTAGIRVDVGVLEAEAARMNEAFFLSIRDKRPYVHLKLAATLDGKIATRTGDSRWISSEQSRRRVHELRDRCGAVVVGVSTAAQDNPRLTVRLPGRPERCILRFVLDPVLRIPSELHLLSREEAAHTVLVCSDRASPERIAALQGKGAAVLCVSEVSGRLDLGPVLEDVYRRGRMELLVEGGSETARAFLDAGFVDRIHIFLSPRILGGRDAVPLVGGVSPERIEEALRLAEVEVDQVGPDVYVTGTLRRE